MPRVQRKFSAPVSRSRFSPERLLTPPPFALKRIFSPEPDPIPHSPAEPQQHTARVDLALDASGPTTPLPNPAVIPKPRGEVGRIGRGGYSLRTTLVENDEHWDTQLFLDVQVSRMLENGAHVEADIDNLRNIFVQSLHRNSTPVSRSGSKIKINYKLFTTR